MNKLDQFESVFKAAAKEPFELQPVAINKVLLVTDLDPYHTELLAEKHDVDLLVFNTKEEDQLAMHGVAYPLAVELRRLPLLML